MLGLSLGTCYAAAIEPGSSFSPASLNPLAWYDPSDLASVWQDSAGTVAGAVNSPIGKLTDKSGNSRHALQATAGSRPTLIQDGSGRNCVRFDGVATFLDFAAWANDAVFSNFTMIAALISRHVPSAASNAMICYYNGAQFIVVYDNDNTVGTGGTRVYANSNAISENVNLNGVSQVMNLRVVSGTQNLRRNGAQIAAASAAFTLSGAVVNSGLAKQTSTFSQYDLYGLILVAGALSAGQIAAVETWMGAKIGLAL